MSPDQRSKLKGLVAAVALATGISAGVLYGSADVVEDFEGLATTAYADMADPNLPTVCYGETQGVKFGDKHTPDECAAMLIKRLPDYILPVKALLPDLPENRQVAYASFSWNLGVGALTWRTKRCVKRNSAGACLIKMEIAGTSIVDLEHAGKTAEACNRLLQFDKAGGKQVKGLTRRRVAERKICLGKETA